MSGNALEDRSTDLLDWNVTFAKEPGSRDESDRAHGAERGRRGEFSNERVDFQHMLTSNRGLGPKGRLGREGALGCKRWIGRERRLFGQRR